MTNPDFTFHRERLLALRARLQGDMTQMEDNALNKDHNKTTSMPNHMAELGSGNFDQELSLSLLGSEKDALDQIGGALKRIEDGSFGECEECGMKIPKARLEAIPYAALCVQCASQREKGQRGCKPKEEALASGARASVSFQADGEAAAESTCHPPQSENGFAVLPIRPALLVLPVAPWGHVLRRKRPSVLLAGLRIVLLRDSKNGRRDPSLLAVQ